MSASQQPSLPKKDSQPIPAPQQQVSPPWSLHTSPSYTRNHTAGETTTLEKRSNDDELVNDVHSFFVQRHGIIVPADPNELKETPGRQFSGNDFQQKQEGHVVERPDVENTIRKEHNARSNVEKQKKQVMSPPLLNRDDNSRNVIPIVAASQAEQPSASKRASKYAAPEPNKIRAENNELQDLEDRVDGILDH